MKRFAALYEQLDRSTRTSDKLDALEQYFRSAPPQDAAWGLYFLTGRKLRRGISSTLLRRLAAEASGLPGWLVDECHEAVGDLSETLALLLPPPTEQELTPPLSIFVEHTLLPLAGADEKLASTLLRDAWRRLAPQERFVFHKLMSTTFRVGVGRTLVVKALARVADVPAAVMDHRLLGRWTPTAASFLELVAPQSEQRDSAQPYPFLLASQAADPALECGDAANWLVEWKWDGIRAQLICRAGRRLLWSRGEEIITHQFPEIVQAAAALPEGCVLDGEILAWEAGRPLPFSALQRRLNRKKAEPTFWPEVPVIFLAFDLLELDGVDWRDRPLIERRDALEALVRQAARPDGLIQLSEPLVLESWAHARQLREDARQRGVEGLVLKRRDSVYPVGRPRGVWWKWKVDPYTVDAVLVGAQAGHGRRAGLFTDYTFAVWKGDTLAPIAKAYSGLTDEEIATVDDFVRRNTIGRHGPVREVRPELVFELGFEAIAASSRHKSGVALRFPRMLRWRKDKTPREADTLETLVALLQNPRPHDVS